jgi:ElaB/YqjD/DUF883 family membrane-anchored ribosome-binding protein
MPESKHRSSDVPNFDTYPSSPPSDVSSRGDIGKPYIERLSQRSLLEQRAVELGAAAGRISVIIRQTQEGLESLAHHGIYDRVSGLAENARARTEQIRHLAVAKAQQVTQAAGAKAAELGRQTREKTTELARQAKSGYHRARLRASQTVREYPVETALAAGTIGLLAGIALRIGRAKRAY